MNRNPPTLAELLLRSDFGCANPARVRELLEREANRTPVLPPVPATTENDREAA